MSDLIPSLALLACPIGMGLMMWFMMRGPSKRPDHAQQPTKTQDGSGSDAEVARLRAELDQLKGAHTDREPDPGRD
ncbi:MAG: hypothetical protein ACRDPT_12200 [Streptomycetales bacterium]